MIQSSVTTNKVLLSPEVFNSQQAMSVSRVNVTLESIRKTQKIPPLQNPRSVGNLVYRYNNPNGEGPPSADSKNIGGSSSGSSSSSSESNSSSQENTSNSSSSSSSEEDEQHRPRRDSAPNVPFLPFFVGIEGNKIGASDQVDPVKSVVKLATKIGSDLEDPSNLIDENTLARFNIMSGIVRTMDRKDIDDATRALWVSPPRNPSPKDNIKLSAW
jgi:hypothetical protein